MYINPDMFAYTTKADEYVIKTLNYILDSDIGSLDIKPRAHWKDGAPAHAISANHIGHEYDLGEDSPFMTLRPTSYKSAIGEILWIYRDASNNLDELKDKYNITWWDSWDIGNRTIGACYGEAVRRYDLLNNLIKDIYENPDGRRHIMSLWQEADFKEPHGLKPCCYQTTWKVRHKDDQDYIDWCLFQRSSDFIVSGNINTLQYIALGYMIVAHLNYMYGKEQYKVGRFCHFIDNCHIYDKHIDQAKELIARKPFEYKHRNDMPRFEVEPQDIWKIKVDDIKVVNYDRDAIAKINPQMKFEVAI